MQQYQNKFKNYKLCNKILKRYLLLLTFSLIFSTYGMTSELDIPHSFVANQAAVAAEVNANFNATESAINNNHSRIKALETAISTMQSTISALTSESISQQNTITTQQALIDQLQSDLTEVENNTVLELDGLLQHEIIDNHDSAVFSNTNVYINSGNGSTSNNLNGKGNLILGYHNSSVSAPFFCSDPQYTDSVNCIGNLHEWGQNIRTGSHNIILGSGHSYTKYAAIITGERNVSNAGFANVIGGRENIASGFGSVMLGGSFNTSSGSFSAITGGIYNSAFEFYSSVTGGRNNTASNDYSSVSGGNYNIASGNYSSVTGGTNNEASGDFSVVSGGASREASNNLNWVAGSLLEEN